MTFRTVSFKGTAITSGQRRQLAFQQQVRTAFLSDAIQETVDQTIAALAARKEQGTRPEKVWTVERQESGTLCIADWMGY